MTEIAARAMTTILAPAEAVYHAIVRADTMAAIFPDRASGDLADGAEVRWEFDHADAVVDIRMVSLRRPEEIVFEWNAAGAGFKSVTFALESLGDDATRVSVAEVAFPLDEEGAELVGRQAAGWSEFLCYLKAYLQYDVELRVGRDRRPDPDPEEDR